MNSIELAIFDLDGTLLDTIEDLGDSMNEMLTGRGHPLHDYETYCGFIGDGMEQLVRRALPEGSDAAELAEALAEYRTAYGRNWQNKSKPYEGILDLLKALAADGVRLAVLSNKPHEFTVKCVEVLLPSQPFERVYGEREGIPRKPDPGAALAIAEELGVAAEHCMFIGDSGVDVRTGADAGMVAVGVLWGFRGEEELRAAGAAHLVSNPAEISELCR